MQLSQIFSGSRLPYNSKNVKLGYMETLPGKSKEELYRAQDGIGNYLKAHSSKVEFFDPRRLAGDFDNPTMEENLDKYVGIKVTNNKTHRNKYSYINYYEKSDKPFLRRVYESIQRMTEGKKSPIEQMKRQTLLKLMEQGKIKI
ncbi:MAG: hypothetical protein LUB59_05800 [Candidatus Gastranaerophilales bacterium]|nr:hypothetical protein [Candidatus Gastranaerophilales bacterium]